MEPTLKNLRIPVVCPFSMGKPYIVYVVCIQYPDGHLGLFRSNGCDNMSGASTCQRCAHQVVSFLSASPSASGHPLVIS